MRRLKRVLRYIVLGILILLALCGIPIAGWLPQKREMDVDNEVKTEIVEGVEESDKT
ncbi:MAG TPA: hypothetical protein VK508_07805 [Cyclobacteriaceae bacterium]|nr:hypothetical protein [Cyclobacteriaceae bacterium]